MRNAFAAEMTKLATEDERIVLLTGDIGNNLFNTFKAEHPTKFYNCGIAEANMTGVAAGMALCGLKPVTYTIAAFNPGRCAEQVRLDIALHNLPVVIVGVGAGLSYASLGPTHHALEDIAWMRSIPNMTIICPGDTVETRLALRAALAHNKPIYLRLGKKNEPLVHKSEANGASEPAFQIGKGITISEGKDATIFSVGTMLPIAIEAAQILSKQGLSVGVISLHTVKPLDEELLKLHCTTRRVIAVVEEHVPAGGAWSAIAEWMSEQGNIQARLVRCGTDDVFFTEGGNQKWAQKHFDLTPEGIAHKISTALK